MTRWIFLFSLLLVVGASGCATFRQDRCFLEQWRYTSMKVLFEETGSYQRVAQAMNDEGWALCEINSFRYQLREELGLVGPTYDRLFVEYEPYEGQLDFRPGHVQGF